MQLAISISKGSKDVLRGKCLEAERFIEIKNSSFL